MSLLGAGNQEICVKVQNCSLLGQSSGSAKPLLYKEYLAVFFIPRFMLQERKILRQFWQQTNLHTPEASFHVVVTSYNVVVQDLKYFNKVKWQYLILDEAQSIKSTLR